MKKWMRLMPALVLLTGARVRAEETLEALQKRLDTAGEKLQAVQYTVESHNSFESEGFKQKTETQTTMAWKRKGKVDLYLRQTKTTNTSDSGKSESTISQAFDGEIITTVTTGPDGKLAIKQKPEGGGDTVPHGAAVLEATSYELKLLPHEKVDGRDCAVVEQTVKGGASPAGMPARYKLWVDMETGLMAKRVGYGPKDAVIAEDVTKDVKINLNLPDDHFKVAIPEGTQVIDMTQLQAGPGK
ncbi:MAG TPA: hypothetical protein VGM03_02395 [Phycisphaerae bacterium]|jgi:outer membrane lipoprotein-sorting protein